MPADRLFHPRLGHSAKVSSLSDLEYRVWTTYVLTADDFGVLRASPLAIQAASTALEHRTRRTIATCLDRLITVGLVRTFTYQGDRYLYQPDWQDFQKVRFPAWTMHPIPRDADVSTQTTQLWDKHPGGRRTDDGRASDERPSDDSRATVARQTDDRRASVSPTRGGDRETANGKRLTAHGTGEESEKGDRRQRAPSRGLQRGDDLQANFARFWAAYPHKVGKDAALRAFRTLRPDNELTDRMVAAVEQHGASEQWQKDGGQFIPHPKTWLREGRWKDEGVTRSAPEASVDLKRLLWRALRPEDGRVWLEHATVEREGLRVRLCTVAPDKLQPAHAALQAALRAQVGADVSLAIVGPGGEA